MTVNAGDLLELQIFYTAAGQMCLNKIGFYVLQDSSQMEDLGDDFVDTVVQNGETGLEAWLHPMGTGSVCNEIRVVDVKPHLNATYIRTGSPLASGAQGGGGDALPPQDALVITFRTASVGRAYRGRVYLAGQGEGHQNGGVWSAGILAAAEYGPASLTTRYLAGTGTNTNWAWSVISRQLNQVIRPEPVGTFVTSYTVRDTVYTQRRRTRGRGI